MPHTMSVRPFADQVGEQALVTLPLSTQVLLLIWKCLLVPPTIQDILILELIDVALNTDLSAARLCVVQGIKEDLDYKWGACICDVSD